MKMRFGIVDLGTNSVRFDIHEINGLGEIRCLRRYKEMVRLGEKVFETSCLQRSAVNRTKRAIKTFLSEAKAMDVQDISGVATSACREAKDGKSFVKELRSEFGLNIRLISGKEEAAYILKGIQAFEPLARKDFAFVDIGGGSTEVGVWSKGQTVFLQSFALGAARLRQNFLEYPPSKMELKNLRAKIRTELGKSVGFKDWPKVSQVLGSSGTVKALCRIMKEMGAGTVILRPGLKALVEEMSILRIDELIHIPGMEEKRLDIILTGALILEEILDFLKAKEVVRTKFALREGLVQEKIEDFLKSEMSKLGRKKIK